MSNEYGAMPKKAGVELDDGMEAIYLEEKKEELDSSDYAVGVE